MLVDVTEKSTEDRVRPYSEFKDKMSLEQYERDISWFKLHKNENFPKGVYWGDCGIEYNMIEKSEWCNLWIPDVLIPSYDEHADENSLTPVLSHGICDSPEQFFDLVGTQLEDSSRKYCVSFFGPMNKKDFECFRFHKNGPYIGKQQYEGYEHFGDEPHMEEVCKYTIFQILDEDEGAYTILDYINECKKD